MILNLRIVCFIDTFSEIIYYLKFMIISRPYTLVAIRLIT